MKKQVRQGLSVGLSILLMVAMLLGISMPAGAVEAYSSLPQAHYGEYLTLAMVYDYGGCYSMQGIATDKTYTYCAKINGNDTSAFVMRTDKSTGTKTYMTNASTGTYFFSNLGHANALDIVTVNGKQNLFVTAGATLVRLTISGSTLTTAGTYTASLNGATASMTAVQIMSASDTEVKVIVKSGRTLYTGTLDPRASSGDIALTKLCTLNVSQIRLKGSVIDYSKFTQQGFDYHDGKVFLPLTGNAYVETINYSMVAVYDLEGASGELKNDPSLSFRVVSGNYSGLFEIEDVAVCPMTGQLYFSVQRRKTASDTDYDAVSMFYGYRYNPAMSTIGADDFRWETIDNELVSVTDGGNVYNRAERFHGDINNNVMSQSIFSLSRSVVLNHDVPWVIEWKSSGTFDGGAMMFASARNWGVTDAAYLFRYQQSGFIAFGAWDGTQHNNYGLSLISHGIDGTAEHVYRLTNKTAADGSNMVYLSVDGVELGAMNNYYINATSQNKTSDWVSGKDFTFSYIGSYGHPMSDVHLSYLQVWADGVTEDTPDNFRWDTTEDQLTSATGGDYTTNQPIMYRGSVTDGVYSAAAHRLTHEVVLMHDRPWSVEWQFDGGLSGSTFLLASSDGANTTDAPYLFRYGDSGLLALGYRGSNGHNNFGVNLADLGIDGSVRHIYRLTNKIAADGSNMVYLSVDGVEVGAMNNHYVGLTSQGVTSDWLNGKDLVFDYVGTSGGGVNGTMGYLQVWEDGLPYAVEFRDYDGTLLSSAEYAAGATPTPPAEPTREGDAQYTYTFAGWTPEVTAVSGNVTYTATYTVTLRTYVVTFLNEDGTMLNQASYPYGQMPIAPADPVKEQTQTYTYTFAGWDRTIVPVTGDATYTATYKSDLRKYDITFVDEDGTVLATVSTAYGSYPTAPASPTKASDVRYVYSFAGWSPELYQIKGEATFTATYAASPRQYTVTFRNADGNVLSSEQVAYGQMPTIPADPSLAPTRKHTYRFAGWDSDVVPVTGNVEYIATYNSELRKYTITFVNEDGSLIAQSQVEYGTMPSAPENPTKASTVKYDYSFDGWDSEVVLVTGDATYTAIYLPSLRQYTVTFVNEDGSLLLQNQVNYGAVPAEPEAPSKASTVQYSYTFAGWDTEVVAVTGDVTYKATYTSTLNKYTVTFVNDDGTVLKQTQIAYGQIPVAPSNPTKSATSQYIYTFAGWNPRVVGVTGNATYTATYTADEILLPAIKPSYPSLSFEGEILYNVYYTVENMGGIAAKDMGLIIFATRDANGTISNAIENISGAETDGSTYMVRSNGIPAKNLGDTVYFKIYAKMPDGSYVYSDVMGYNAVAYANTILNKSTSSQKDKALVVAMLNYGAAAQEFFNYKKESLVNANLTQEQQALVSAYRADMVQDVVKVDASKAGAFQRNGGYSNMYASVSFDGAFSINYYFTPSQGMDSVLTLYYWDIETYTSGAVLTAQNAAGKITMVPSAKEGEYGATVSGIAAKEIDETVLVAGVYESGGTTYCTGVISYSLGKYCMTYTDNDASDMQSFAQATVVYGHYAKQYFAS